MASKSIIKTKNFLNTLKRVYLGGIIEECVLEINKGKCLIEAVDMTNHLIVLIEKSIMSKDVDKTNLGIGNMDILIKFLATIEDDKLAFRKRRNKIFMQRGDRKRSLEYLLTDEELISTRLNIGDGGKKEKENTKKKIAEMMDYSVELTQSFIKDFLSYIGFLKTKSVMIKYNSKKDQVLFTCGSINDHRFRLILDSSVETSESDDIFGIKVNGDYLSRILSVMNFSGGEDEPPTLSFAKEKPIMIEYEGAVWALLPLDLEEEEE